MLSNQLYIQNIFLEYALELSGLRGILYQFEKKSWSCRQKCWFIESNFYIYNSYTLFYIFDIKYWDLILTLTILAWPKSYLFHFNGNEKGEFRTLTKFIGSHQIGMLVLKGRDKMEEKKKLLVMSIEY